jgi:hypothetical protein
MDGTGQDCISKIIQTKKDKYCIFFLICENLKSLYQIRREKMNRDWKGRV